MTLKITQESSPAATTIKTLEDGLVSYNTSIAGANHKQNLWLIGRDNKGAVKAGLKGVSFYQWLFIDWLWVAEDLRGQDYGTKLLHQAEAVARERSCIGVFLDTYSFQAPDFYTKHGYTEFGRLNDFPIDRSRIWFSKMLRD